MIDSKNATFYVSPDGDDENPGSIDSPFATLAHARDAVREWSSAHGGNGALVLFREGVYRFSQTVVFGCEDSAPSGTLHTYASFPGEKAVFSAGMPIERSRWQKLDVEPDYVTERARGKLWVADISDNRSQPAPVLTLFDGSAFLPRARGEGFALRPDPPGTNEEIRRNSLNVPDGAIKDVPDLPSAEVVVIPKWTWTMNILPIESFDGEGGIIRTRVPHTYPMRPNSHIEKSVWLENSLSVLDSPGEWVCDSNGRVYYWPEADQPGEQIEYAALTELIRVEGEIDYNGTSDHPVHGIRFSGITFTHSERYPWYGKTGWGIQHDWEAFDRPTSMVRLRGAERCVIDDCHFTCGSSAGVRLDLHCRKNVVSANLFNDLGGVAILLCGYGPGTKDVNNHNTISDNHIHHIGLAHWHSPAIFVWQSGNNTISHNHIHHTGYTGIVVSGRMRWDREGIAECSRTVRWHETEQVVGRDYRQQTWHQAWYPDWKRRNALYHGHDNVLEYNDIHHVMQIMGDGNGVYISGTGADNIVRFNSIHDCPSDTMAEGLRCDDDQHDTTLHGNLIYNLGGFATGITIKGINRVTNNIIACGIPQKTRRGYISLEVGPLYGSVIKNNILYATSSGHALYYQGPRIHGEGPLPLVRDCDAESNIYWCTEDPERCYEHLKVEREFGNEKSSVVADPEFLDPAHGDFRLKDSSPAIALGFEKIDYGKIGTTDKLRADYR